MENGKALPIFGIGPIYMISCLMMSICALIAEKRGLIATLRFPALRNITAALGVLFIGIGVFLWVKAVIFDKITKSIQSGKLATTGIYAIVRNPIYSAFLFIFSGVLLIDGNLYLLFLPVLFWIYVTLLMKFTEEKWLAQKFGEEYIEYCKKVNRVIPWFQRK